MADIITKPIKFLGATVLSFNTSLGLGSASESTLNVDLIEDCDKKDKFLPTAPPPDTIEVGCPVYFDTTTAGGGFVFGGVLTNWTVTQSNSGRVFNVKVSDPRQLLENTTVIIDSYLGAPESTTNYFNVYNHIEGSIIENGCDAFGNSGSSERGMPYTNIINALQEMNPVICSPTGYNYVINFSSFPQNIPEYYRVAGPGVSILQLLQDVCDVLGLEFHVYLVKDLLTGNNVITIGTIDLKNSPDNFNTILNVVNSFNGTATDITYGHELRNEKNKVIILGEQQHYLTVVDNFEYFFGEDSYGDELVPVVPYANDKSGFWIAKKIDSLNASLSSPLASNGPYTISELDIRMALSGYDMWLQIAMDPTSPGTFNKAIREHFADCEQPMNEVLNNTMGNPNLHPERRFRAMIDLENNPNLGGAKAALPKTDQDLQAIHSFVQNLGSTYYGKQWISKLKQKICYHQGENYQEIIFTDVPTAEGGWVDGDLSVLGLGEPELSFFRSDDNRIKSFAVFSTADLPEDANPGGNEDPGQSSTPGSESPGGSQGGSFYPPEGA